MDEDRVGRYERVPFPASRTLSVDTVRVGKSKHHIPVLAEIDVTDARRALAQLSANLGETISFTGWFVLCLAKAAAEHREVHSARRGRHLYLFDDVDVSLLVYRPIPGTDPPRSAPMPYVIRRAQTKTLLGLHHEIREAQGEPLRAGEQVIDPRSELPSRPGLVHLFYSVPGFLRDLLLWRRLLRDPFLLKRTCGTIVVTSVGMYGRHATGSGWGIPISFLPMVVALGSIARKPGLVGDRVEPREILSLTVLFDHDVVDGAPIAEFLARLNQLIDVGYGIADAAPRPSAPSTG